MTCRTMRLPALVSMLAFASVMVLHTLAVADPAQHRHYRVFVGSAFFLDHMTDKTAWPYVAANADGFYCHPVGWRSLNAAQKHQILANFAHKTAIMESDLSGTVARAMKERDMIVPEMASDGMPTEALFENRVKPNEPQDTVSPDVLAASQSEWTAFCQDTETKTQAATYFMAGAFLLDGDSDHRSLTWNSPAWDYIRTDLLVPGCGGAGLDSPVDNYLLGPVARRQAVWDMTLWTQRHGKTFIYLVSPGNPKGHHNGTMFIQHLRQTVDSLEDHDAEPDVYAVETYIPVGPDTVPERNPDGSAASTIAGGAYYLLKHRDGEPGTLGLSYQTDDQAAPTQNPVTGQTYHLIVTLTNSSPWLDYAAVLKAAVTGGGDAWTAGFSIGGTDVTPQLLGTGYVFCRSHRLNPQSSQQVDVTLTRKTSDGSTTPLTLAFQVLPHSGSDALTTLTLIHQ